MKATTMIRMMTAAGIAASVGLLASVASAQTQTDFGQQGEFILSADRLVPFLSYTHWSADVPGTNATDTGSQSSLFFFYGSTLGGGATNVNAAGNAASVGDIFFTVPRVGLDYVIVPHVTLGGDIIFFATLGGSTQTIRSNGSSDPVVDSPSTTLFGIAPRGGYILPLNDMFSIWLRGGFSYYTASTTYEGPNNNTNATTTFGLHQFAIDLDPQLVITPIPHVGFTAGITADIPFAGGDSFESPNVNGTVSASSSILYLGVTLGMLAHF